MARMRTVKPETFTSETLARLPLVARWTFVGLWTYCDDEGRGRGDARLVRAALWPLDDDVTVSDVSAHLDLLEAERLLCRYEVSGKLYLHVVNFAEHQHPNRPAPSRLPECPHTTHGGLTASAVSRPEQRTAVVVAGSREQVAGNAAPRANGGEPSVGKRANDIADRYCTVVPLSRHPAIAGIVRKAINSGRYPDGQILAAVLRLADERRSVTVETLRIELEGLPPRGPPSRQEATDAQFDRQMARAQEEAR